MPISTPLPKPILAAKPISTTNPAPPSQVKKYSFESRKKLIWFLSRQKVKQK
jgi:hypothetical protein